MAKEIIRDGIKYSVAHTFKFDKDGNISESYDGGEISESDVDSLIEHEKANAELEKQDKMFAMIDAEAAEDEANIIKAKSKSKSKSKTKGII